MAIQGVFGAYCDFCTGRNAENEVIVKAVENIMVATSMITSLILQNSAIAFMPLVPTIWTGVVFGQAITPMVGATIGGALGVLLGVTMEGTGMLCFYAAQEERKWHGKIYPALYLASGIVIAVVLKPEYFLLSTMLFGMVGLTYSVAAKKIKLQEQKREAAENKRLALDARQKQAEQEAELSRREKDAEHERKLAVISAKRDIELAKVAPKVLETFPPAQESFQKVPQTFPRDWRKLSPEQRDQIATMDEAEIVLMAGVDVKTARAWLKKLQENGNEH
jgi:large-conductance mechanosensitive channel